MSDLYEVRLSPGATRALAVGPPRGLLVAAASAVYKFLDGPLRQDPWRVSKPLRDELEGFRGARRGEYRVVLSVNEQLRVFDIVRIDWVALPPTVTGPIPMPTVAAEPGSEAGVLVSGLRDEERC